DAMSETGNSVSQGKRSKETRDGEQENSLRPARRRTKTPGRPVTSAVAAEEKKKERPTKRATPEPVPDEVRAKFVRIKNAYFFADGAKAFTDRGDRLTTPSENTEVVRSLITIAQARGWNEVVVQGSERFRREAWA